MQPKHYVWIALGAGLLAGIAGWALFGPRHVQAPSSTASSTTSGAATTTTVDLGGGVQVQVPAGTVISVDNGIPAPSLKPIAFASTVSPDVKAALQAQYDVVAPQLRASPNRVDLWLQLGIEYKIGGDYADAAAVWTFVSKAAPNDVAAVAYGNLGDLYLNFTHEYAKSEAAYKAALAVKPNVADYQAGLKAAQHAQGK